MACKRKYINITAAAVSGAGSGLALAVGIGTTPTGAGVPLTIGGAFCTLGSILWLIAAINDLIECLEKAGRHEEAERLRGKVERLEQDVVRLKETIEDLRGKAS